MDIDQEVLLFSPLKVRFNVSTLTGQEVRVGRRVYIPKLPGLLFYYYAPLCNLTESTTGLQLCAAGKGGYPALVDAVQLLLNRVKAERIRQVISEAPLLKEQAA